MSYIPQTMHAYIEERYFEHKMTGTSTRLVIRPQVIKFSQTIRTREHYES